MPDSEIQVNRENDPKDPEFTLFRQVPNTPKPSDLNFAALEGSISLENVFTVKDIIARIAQATGLELYADTRVEYLSVSLRGDRARINDLLQALCLGVGGTIRQVGDAYFLTEERVPWFAGTVAHRELKDRATRLSDSARARLTQKLEKDAVAIGAGIPALPGEPHPNTLSISSITEYNAPDLSPLIKRRISELIENNERKRATNEYLPAGLKGDGVLLDPALCLWLSLPDRGNLTSLGLDDHVTGVIKDALLSKPATEDETPEIPAELKKPVRWPTRWNVRIVRLAPKTPDEAVIQAQAARAAGFTELWLDTPVEQRQAGALVTAAAKNGLPVTLVVSPLERAPGTDGDGFLSDILASGETTDGAWRRHNLDLPEGLEPDSAPVPRFLFPEDSIITAVGELARIPGIKGIALRELDRPGYVSPQSRDSNDGDVKEEIEEGGFILAWRLAFIRRWNLDPADLVPVNSSRRINRGGFFDEPSWAARRDWHVFRSRQGQRWRQLLYTRLRATNPQAPLFIHTHNRSSEDASGIGFLPWPNGAVLPLVNPQGPYFIEFQVPAADSPEKMRGQLNRLMRENKGSRFLCDLSQVSALPYLELLRQAPRVNR